MKAKTIFQRLFARRCGSSRRKSTRGTEVLELALLLPILIAFAFGTIEFGYFFFLQNNLQAAAREGARAGVPWGATSGDATAKATQFLQNAQLNPGNFTISVNSSATQVEVTVQGSWGSVGTHLLFIPNSKIVVGRAVMRKESPS